MTQEKIDEQKGGEQVAAQDDAAAEQGFAALVQAEYERFVPVETMSFDWLGVHLQVLDAMKVSTPNLVVQMACDRRRADVDSEIARRRSGATEVTPCLAAAVEKPRFDDLALDSMLTTELLAYHAALTEERKAAIGHPIVHQALALRAYQIESAIAVRNAQVMADLDDAATQRTVARIVEWLRSCDRDSDHARLIESGAWRSQ